ncbi:WXG100 family type VII secretion target [Microbacterium sp. SORGH_AS_0888]|uniref:WXG100 family type VII secretion target n=1 Tax=Microbacterium sp. SORGH_AS_0888 TaxID=3041791 RepID=UPI0027886D5F|nr:WXG100 family type VII secretion target [Microbacterium sp. SORGH_AS_0888]MDQ1129712.1 WXG100 family type VII secretion target [Microbacterium sp. SORGH_AS_0888]
MTLTFDPDRHAETLANLRQATATIQEELEALDRAVATLRGQWSGVAQAAYDREQREWTGSMNRMRSALQNTTDAAQAAGDRLTQAEADVTALWS